MATRPAVASASVAQVHRARLPGGDVVAVKVRRPDIEELTAYGAGLGLRMAITPATTALCSAERIRALVAEARRNRGFGDAWGHCLVARGSDSAVARRDAAGRESGLLARERTGIANLRVLYHRVFGYLIEVTRSQLGRVPEDYVRRQTLTGAERFATPIEEPANLYPLAIGVSFVRTGEAARKAVRERAAGGMDAIKITVEEPYALISSGQTCNAHTRMLVPEHLYGQAAALAIESAAAYKPGDPASDQTRLGPLASAAQLERVRGYIQKGIEEGAELLLGGAEAPEGMERGFYAKPTVFGRVTPEMTIAREEIFGPNGKPGRKTNGNHAPADA